MTEANEHSTALLQNQSAWQRGSEQTLESYFDSTLGSIPGLGRPPGEGNGYPLQYSRLENSMDCIVSGVTKSRTQLSDFHFSLSDSTH